MTGASTLLRWGMDLERARESTTHTRAGIGGISTTVLKDAFGLPQHVVDGIFKGPLTLRLNFSGEAQLVSDATLIFSARFMGD